MRKLPGLVGVGLWLGVVAPLAAQQPDAAEIARLKQQHPHGYHFVDSQQPNGKVVWISKMVRGNMIDARRREFATVADFRQHFLKENVSREVTVGVQVLLGGAAVLGGFERAQGLV